MEGADHCICLGSVLSIRTSMIVDGGEKIPGPAVVEEEDSLAEAPQGSGAEFVGACGALHDPVRQFVSHVMQKQIRVEICVALIQRGKRSAAAGAERGCVAERA